MRRSSRLVAVPVGRQSFTSVVDGPCDFKYLLGHRGTWGSAVSHPGLRRSWIFSVEGIANGRFRELTGAVG